MLNQNQIEQFHRDGFLVVENVVDAAELQGLRQQLEAWIDESRGFAEAYGETIDGRSRFDVDPADHSSEHPALRRVSSPTEISDAYFETAIHSNMAQMAGELIGGSGTRFHHSKVNAKLPHTATTVKWHQDFPFTPHTNDDMITALLMVGEVTEDNGPLQVIPGSQKGELYIHWQDGRFTGKVEDEVEAEQCQKFVSCTGPAGSVCFMHTRLLHASGANNTELPRYLFITVYAAEDAVALSDNPLPSVHQGQLVYGQESGQVRMTANHLKMPQKPKGASFFVQQAGLEMA
ncbi:phytanoyl-CoA dioxygenase family protein [Acinetobacter amyesii]|uniref:phytanoyl-CoA dioxygenase family protein n=1 Tax=Acinetobacter amyesii TaxID=2942470 RepID=UPI0020BEFB6A|nr:phytanoyl-CoA dioxygenase family protein [Acinetobacter amyesii]MCL6233099.1 phytanoyl-CoA dioxygenase family protein [Acinetobacter amyesii]